MKLLREFAFRNTNANRYRKGCTWQMQLTNGPQTQKVRELGDSSQTFSSTQALLGAVGAFKGLDTQAAPSSVPLGLKDSSS